MKSILNTIFMLIMVHFSPALAADEIPLIAAASDLQFALVEVADQFTKDTGNEVRLVFGSSGNFFRQIREGGPFEVYLSADENYVFDLAKNGLTIGEGALYAEGRIVVVVPHGSSLKVDGSLHDLAEQLDRGEVKTFAIANPDHAPYGRAAREALQNAGVWDKIQDHLVIGENVSQAAQFAISGSATGGIVAYSLALSPKVSALAEFALIPNEWHQPLRQRMVLTKKAGAVAKEFYAYVQSPPARAVLQHYGFTLTENR